MPVEEQDTLPATFSVIEYITQTAKLQGNPSQAMEQTYQSVRKFLPGIFSLDRDHTNF